MRTKVFIVLALAAALFLSACGKSDADLTKAATDKIVADKIGGVTVVVKDGVAALSGDVADITVKTKAEASIKSVEGVKSVTNNITVKAPTPATAPPDPMLQGKVDEALRKAGCTGAKATIANGVITLTGTVPEAKYGQCFQVVNEIGGAKIDNQLQKGK